MEPAYISALAALAGSMIGGMTSLGASWLSQHVQFRTQQRAKDLSHREALYESFIEEASKLYADAYEHNETDTSKLVNLYALISKIRVLSSSKVVQSADQTARVIIQTYLGPNKSFRDVVEIVDNDALNPLRAFSNACREELREDSV
jgi:hypothetical protein